MKTTKHLRSNFRLPPDRYVISRSGKIFDNSTNSIVEIYSSSNGHNYAILETFDGIKIELVENLMAMSFRIDKPDNTIGKLTIVDHIDGCPRNNNLQNLIIKEDVETFVDIGQLGYESNLWYVSNHGRVYGKRYDKILKQRKSFSSRTQYVSIGGIKRKGSQKTTSIGIHRVVGMLFVPGRSEKFNMINHIDGVTTNNHYLNLEWVDDRLNSIHARKLGLAKTVYGEQTSGAKITESTAREICKLLVDTDGDMQFVCDELGVPFTTVRAIKNGYSWTTISCQYFNQDHFRAHRFTKVMDVNTVRFICENLVKYDFDIDRVFQLVKHLPYMNREKVYRIAAKDSWKQISDEFF